MFRRLLSTVTSAVSGVNISEQPDNGNNSPPVTPEVKPKGPFPLEDYEVDRSEGLKRDGIIGKGGFGYVTVYKRKEEATPSPDPQLFPDRVAVKTFNSSDAFDHAKYAKREKKAAEKFKKSGQSNIVTFLGTAIVNDKTAVVMELCHINLGSFVNLLEGRLHAQQAAQIMVQICKGVQFVHQSGFIHRDLKPGNILLVLADKGTSKVTEKEWLRVTDFARITFKIADFGLARKKVRKAMTGKLGSKYYQAPEVRNTEMATYDGKMDVYSLGIIFFELLCGSVSKVSNISKHMSEQLQDLPHEAELITAMTQQIPFKRIPLDAALRKMEELATVENMLVDNWDNLEKMPSISEPVSSVMNMDTRE